MMRKWATEKMEMKRKAKAERREDVNLPVVFVYGCGVLQYGLLLVHFDDTLCVQLQLCTGEKKEKRKKEKNE